MKLVDIDLSRLMPQFMEDDPSVKAMNKTLEPMIKELVKNMRRLSIWDNLSSLTEEELDNLAYEFDIPWYNNTYEKERKLTIIKECPKLMASLGTPYTFMKVIQDIFGSCTLEEAGINYDGEPHHFRIMVGDGENLDKETYGRLNYIIEKVKRKSSWLDSISSIYNANMQELHVMRVQDISIDSLPMVRGN